MHNSMTVTGTLLELNLSSTPSSDGRSTFTKAWSWQKNQQEVKRENQMLVLVPWGRQLGTAYVVELPLLSRNLLREHERNGWVWFLVAERWDTHRWRPNHKPCRMKKLKKLSVNRWAERGRGWGFVYFCIFQVKALFVWLLEAARGASPNLSAIFKCFLPERSSQSSDGGAPFAARSVSLCEMTSGCLLSSFYSFTLTEGLVVNIFLTWLNRDYSL